MDVDDNRPFGPIDIELVLSADGETIVATMNDRAVVYRPNGDREAYLCDRS